MRRAVLRTDGGSRGNPGPGGAGFVIEEDGAIVCEGGRFLGNVTNNVAEYEALIWGLENARKMSFDEVHVYADSELLVKQLTGAYKVKNAGLKPLFIRAMSLLRSFSAWEAQHVRRENNCEADALANAAMDTCGTVGNPVHVHGAPESGQDVLF